MAVIKTVAAVLAVLWTLLQVCPPTAPATLAGPEATHSPRD